MIRVAVDAGHGMNTDGKRTPDGEHEWSFNNKVALAVVASLSNYRKVEVLRLDDPSGKNDVQLKSRTDLANRWGANLVVSIHHNAYLGKWGTHGGVETYTFPGASQKSREIANVIHPLVVKAMGLRDRGLKTMNLHIVRESKMPAILIEGGFMDSTIDINALRDNKRLTASGQAVARGIANYFNLKLISNSQVIVYRYGDIGQGIRLLQKNLTKLGFNLALDNSFGPLTLSAVKDFQYRNGLAIDGVVGPLTQQKIEDLLL